jgi:hypothetical protein
MVLLAGDRWLVAEPGETWVFEGGLWARRFPAHTPQAFIHHRMAYDERLGRVVLIGYRGRGPYGSEWLEVWEWDGADWREVARNGVWPYSRDGFGFAYDSRRGRHVISGGALSLLDAPYFVLTAETWEFDAVGS